MAYAENEDILNAISAMRPDFRLPDIKDFWVDLATFKVDSYLRMAGLTTPCTDIADMLKYASIFMYLEAAANVGQIQSTFGDLKKRKTGDVEYEFDPKSPMFFFAGGSVQGFYDLLPHETWRMQAYQVIKGYIRAEYVERSGQKWHYAAMAVDDSDRGYNPNGDYNSSDTGVWEFGF